MVLPWLHRDGKYIKDTAGNTIAMRGIHVGYWRESYGVTINQHVIDVAKGVGCPYLEMGITNNPAATHYYNVADFTTLDSIVALCKANNMYLVLNFLEASTDMINSGRASGWSDCIPVSWWRTIIQHYANDSTMMGVKLIDEPNFTTQQEYDMWVNAINALYPDNPNLLWFTHVINMKRMGYTDALWSNNTNRRAPVNNILLDGGWWLRLPEEGADSSISLTATDAEIAPMIQDLTATVTNYQTRSGIPSGLGWGSSYLVTAPQPNAHVRILRDVWRNLEAIRGYQQLYASEYFWQEWYGETMDVTLGRIFPDKPYSYYWGTVNPTVSLTINSAPITGIPYTLTKVG